MLSGLVGCGFLSGEECSTVAVGDFAGTAPLKAVSSIIKRKEVRYFVAEFLILCYDICMKNNHTYCLLVCNINYPMVWTVKNTNRRY